MPWPVVGHRVGMYKCEVHAVALGLHCRLKWLYATRLGVWVELVFTGLSTFLSFVEFVVGHENRVTVRGSVYHSTIHKEKSNKMQQCIKILLFRIYMKLNMFRATHHPPSGA